jgi:ABC-2 type transport system ATP-binding protein
LIQERQKGDSMAKKFKIVTSPKQEPLIALTSVSKSYKKNIVFKNITLDIHEGDKITFLGYNGSGKTTLIEILQGIKVPTTGTISYKTDKKSGISKIISAQHQEIEYPEGYTVEETLRFFSNLEEKNKIKAQSKLIELIDVFGIKKIMKQKLSSLSGGEQQRINLLLSILHRSKILILDEIATGLDIEVYDNVAKYIERYIKKNNITVILISHRLDEIKRFTDKTYVFKNKELAAPILSSSLTPLSFQNHVNQNINRETNKITIKKDVDYENI